MCQIFDAAQTAAETFVLDELKCKSLNCECFGQWGLFPKVRHKDVSCFMISVGAGNFSPDTTD